MERQNLEAVCANDVTQVGRKLPKFLWLSLILYTYTHHTTYNLPCSETRLKLESQLRVKMFLNTAEGEFSSNVLLLTNWRTRSNDKLGFVILNRYRTIIEKISSIECNVAST